ncbi:hypothetical protein HV299_10990 [Klebsiella grimontii]|nr:hypothetical protein HV299_10990 [Klebsiella grimontii]
MSKCFFVLLVAFLHLPDNGTLLVTLENGEIKGIRNVHDDEHVATLNALFELAKLTGYTIIKPDGNML